jgi:nuclear transport factor 2 (NTF2) superfamily protein
MKLELLSKSLMYTFEDEEGTYYRTYDGENWEELMGESWESIYVTGDFNEAFKNLKI